MYAAQIADLVDQNANPLLRTLSLGRSKESVDVLDELKCAVGELFFELYPLKKELPASSGSPSFGRLSCYASPLDLEAEGTLEGIAIREVVECGIDGAFAIERIFVVGPGIGAASADSGPCFVIVGVELHT